MPRQPRLDIPGLVHHVMARGIEGGDIFRCGEDRQDFLKRLADEINKPDGPRLYAWALMTNHFHLLLRPGQGLLSPMMRTLTRQTPPRRSRSDTLEMNIQKEVLCCGCFLWRFLPSTFYSRVLRMRG